jgi:hypothetical protein
MRIVCANHDHAPRRATLAVLRRLPRGWAPTGWTDAKGDFRFGSRNLRIDWLADDKPIGVAQIIGGQVEDRRRYQFWCPLCKVPRSYRDERFNAALDRWLLSGEKVLSLGQLEALL